MIVKLFEYIKLSNPIWYIENDIFLLCIKETDTGYYRKFSKGKKYKIYKSNLGGLRIIDDNKKFERLSDRNFENKDGIFIWNMGGGIFTTDNSIKDYNIREERKKYRL